MSGNGLLYTARYYLMRLFEEFYERRYGVQTKAWLKPEQLGIADADACDYVALPYRVLHRIYRKLHIRPGSGDVLVDMGCGMGRPLVVASRYPFRRIIGVEISPELCEAARKNLTNCRPGARCREFDVVNTNALSYAVPDDVTLVFFYNPFRGETLRGVIENIRQSLVRSPRSLRIIYCNRVFFDHETASMAWIEKAYRTPYFPNGSWALYYTDARLAVAAPAGPRPEAA